LSLLRPLLINPLLILAVALVGAACCHWSGADWHPRELIVAAAVGLLAAEAAVTIVVVQRRATAVQMVQIALVSLGCLLLLSLVLAAAAVISRKVGLAFMWWMLAMFWVTLFGVCGVLVRAMRAAAGVSATPASAGLSSAGPASADSVTAGSDPRPIAASPHGAGH
jgi:hypothetical protein